jgi:hypothetical protein
MGVPKSTPLIDEELTMPKLLLLASAVAGLTIAPDVPLRWDDPDYSFRRELRAGQELSIGNIDGTVTVTRAAGRTAEVLVTKRVIRGNGDLVLAILEETSKGVKVCSVYLDQVDEQRTTCDHRGEGRRRREPLEVEMTYEVRVPDGVDLRVGTVDGDVIVRGIATVATLATVDGDITVTGRAPSRVATVDGDITLDLSGPLPSTMRISTVDGDVAIAVPSTAGLSVHATTVDGDLESDFPITVKGKWGPRTMRGTVGDGATELRISTVDGSIRLRGN